MFRVIPILSALVAVQIGYAQEPPPPPEAPATIFEPLEPLAEDPLPEHWYQTHPACPDHSPHRQPLGDLYLRVDAGGHREFHLPRRGGVGIELNGRLPLPESPWFSIVGGLREEIRENGHRLSWTVAGVSEYHPFLDVGLGVDGIYDSILQSHVGSGFFFVSHDVPQWCSRIGLWTTFEVWDDAETTVRPLGPNVFEFTETGVFANEQTSLFWAAGLGQEGCWGDVYVAPGVEHIHGRFRLSTGYQTTLAERFDAFIHLHKTFGGQEDWSLFGGVQVHFGCGPRRPWDFVMPQRIRARQARETFKDVVVIVP